MFDFNTSLSDVAPVSPNLPIHLTTLENSGLLMDAVYVLFFVCVFTIQTEFIKRCV